MNEIEIGNFLQKDGPGHVVTDQADDLRDAVDNASDQDKSTWLISQGKRIAAIVPVSDAERIEAATLRGCGVRRG